MPIAEQTAAPADVGTSTRARTRGRRWRTPVVAIVLALTMLAMVAVGAVGASLLRDDDSGGAPAALDPGPPPLSLTGNTLTLDGQRVVLAGASAYVMPFYLGPDGGADVPLAWTTERSYRERTQILADMRANDVTTVRMPVALDGYRGDTYGIGGEQAYLERLQDFVNAAAAEDIRVIIGWWDSHGSGSEWLSTYRDVLPMMKDVREALRPWPGVVYEPFNEPHDVTWEQWQPVMQDVVRFWRTDLGYDGVLVLDTINYSWSFDPVVADAMMDFDAGLRASGEPAVLFANHRYANNNTCFCGEEREAWEQEVGQYVGRYPLIGTEYGRWTGPDFTPSPTWNAEFASVLVDDAVPAGLNGYLAFVWDWVDENTMTSDLGRRLTPYGRLVSEDVLQPLAR